MTDLVVVADERLAGVRWLSLPSHGDERGALVTALDRAAWARADVPCGPHARALLSRSRAGVLRGLHAERGGGYKTIVCVSGRVFDVVADARRGSPARGRWTGRWMNEGEGVVVPPGLCHGFAAPAYAGEATLLYLLDAPYEPAEQWGVRFDDAELAVGWPAPPPGGWTLSARDAALPALRNVTPAR